MYHILDLLETLNQDEFFLGVFEHGQMFDRAFKRGINTKLFKQKSKYDFSIINKVTRFIDEEGIDIIHTHGPRANLFGCLIKRKRPECIWVTTVHSNPFHDFLGKGVAGKVFTRLHLMVLKKPDHYFAISSRFKNLLSSQGIEEKKITTIFNGIDFSPSQATDKVNRKNLGLNEDYFVIIMIARLTPVKGHSIALDALKRVKRNYSKIMLLLVGDGFLEGELKRMVTEQDLDENVIFMGYREDVDPLLQISDIKILTSHSESFPLVLLEAARARCPVITTDVGGVKDLIPSEDFGWVVPVNDPSQLESAIIEAIELNQNGELKQLGESLYHRASALFTVENFRNAVLTAYQKLKE
ncbi:glycosyltransferase family 4 protein [Cytobacillus firmus]|uniref:glycosyltransferase family 4 protein n=1 Tax=Cytobacillus firmus TaxID=1399 RepID=UPI002189D552|nr:glycosyltransferase family 4 protein [Cytobacillus firmus]URM33432.1 glycosyltransferase family 4 protein [Cytobacillus firmus]